MIRMSQAKCVCGLLFALMVSATALQAGAEVPRMVLTFYYPWYGVPDGPGGAGRTVHWGRIDAAKKDIAASTHYPAFGAYDSHDPNVLDQHCQWAKYAGIDAFIVSWWGHNSFSDRAMPRILDSCKRHGLHACIYYETVPKPQTPQTAARDIIKVLSKYGEHPAHLRIDGKPVVFVYGRALQQLGLTAWLEAIKIINRDYEEGATAIGDQFSYGAARVFDGLHTYNTAGSLRGLTPGDTRQWATNTYPSWVQLADKAGKISAITVIPGYDDTKIRKPGLAVERYDGELYRVQWEEAIKADPHWVLITSFNEWHEGSEIEPSAEYGQKYLNVTSQYAKTFKAKKPPLLAFARKRGENRVTLDCRQTSSEQFSPQEKTRLRQKLETLRIGALPNAESMAFWWLVDLDITPEMLTWQDVADGLSAKQYAALLYCGPERCRRSVRESGDVDAGLINYLKEGGCIAFLPSDPWPFYYDQNGRTANRSSQFGLTLRGGWEEPPGDTELHFVQPQHYLKRLPKQFAFPTSGDLRWRPFFADNHASHTSILQLRDSDGAYLGDAVAYAEPISGGRIVYTWFSLLEGPESEVLLHDLFDFIATELRQQSN